MHPVYQERVLNAPDICRNCYRLVREKRLKPEWRRSDVSVKEADYSRRRQTTEVAYGPAEDVCESKGIFCDCGTEGSFVRYWEDEDIDADRFRAFVKRLLGALASKGVSLDRETTAAYALQARRDGETVDAALSTGVRYGLQRAEVDSRASTAANAD
jgi:hypothetical protein